MLTKDTCVQKYQECKLTKNGCIPKYREFLKFAGINDRQLARLFGSLAYSKLQNAAGDNANKLQLERTPFATIMQQYGNLVIEFGAVPPSSEWELRSLKPSVAGLRSRPHFMKWSELPRQFVEWATTNEAYGFEKAMEIIKASALQGEMDAEKGDVDFLKLIKDVGAWSPARRRNSEGEYKIELRKHLESLNYKLNEEYGESNYDLLVQGKYAIELKKDPDLSEYDRLFGQVARHLQHQCKVVVVIFGATRKDKYDSFTELIDRYLNVGENSIEVIRK